MSRSGRVLLAASVGLLAAFISLSAPARAGQPRSLSLQERIRAREAVERVYYSHLAGARRPFEEAFPPEVLERKVRASLRQSAALAEIWSSPVTAEMLRAEIERIARETRFPERLDQIYDALDRDPLLILECFARPVLADRLVRSFFAGDTSIHDGARRRAEAIREGLLEGAIDPQAPHSQRTVADLRRSEAVVSPAMAGDIPALELPADLYAERRALLLSGENGIGDVKETLQGFVVSAVLSESPGVLRVASYRVPKLVYETWWREIEGRLDESSVAAVAPGLEAIPAPSGRASHRPAPPGDAGPALDGEHLDVMASLAGGERSSVKGRSLEAAAPPPCLPDDTWSAGVLAGVPEGRTDFTAVWTGTEMIIWGGWDTYFQMSTGGRYDPLTDIWTPTSNTDAPDPTFSHTAVWTGSEMIIWGGYDYRPEGGRYDPITDTWSPIPTAGAPKARFLHTAVWTGTEMIIWGGHQLQGGAGVTDSGGRYDPVANSWTATASAGAPAQRREHTAVWTGTEMIIWGGNQGYDFVLDTGARYDPATDTWTPLPVAGAPLPRDLHSAVWTGSEMIVWGGSDGAGHLDSGGRFDLASGSWAATATAGAPSPRSYHPAVWTGTEMIIWGGFPLTGGSTGTGARYDPATDTWTALPSEGAPTPRSGHRAVWTGSLMIVWGGGSYTFYNPTGGRYDPVADAWTPTSTGSPMGPRRDATAVWTGTEMIVWGGTDGFAESDLGGRYDPLADSWTPTTLAGAPQGRQAHTAVWTGSEMIVWGGFAAGSALGTGARYDPFRDEWNPLPEAGAPSPRSFHTAVWTGSSMVVWGGQSQSSMLGTGGLYDPASGSWTEVPSMNAPAARTRHTAVWTGAGMIVWGGEDGSGPLGTGGRFSPAAGAWAPVAAAGAPASRSRHTAAWTGSEMIVWGGRDAASPLETGGRYDPVLDGWASTSTTHAPEPRYRHTAVWTGEEMIVWGGSSDPYIFTGDGGRYDPVADAWTAMSTEGAPPARRAHVAVHTGSFMIVWGGTRYGTRASGGRYALGHGTDGDGDGVSECAGDCNDGAASVYPGAPEVCDTVDNDCDGLVDEDFDVDGDGYRTCAGDCDDTDPLIFSVPVEVSSLVVETIPGGGIFTWESQAEAAGAGTVYDVFSGLLTDLASPGGGFSTGACLQEDLPDPVLDDPGPDPPPGDARYFLVRAQNGCPGGTGTYGSIERDMGTALSPGSCN